ncbi:LOW QUALITY PROTEIN: optineurin-like [Chlamydotis macqueenii]
MDQNSHFVLLATSDLWLHDRHCSRIREPTHVSIGRSYTEEEILEVKVNSFSKGLGKTRTIMSREEEEQEELIHETETTIVKDNEEPGTSQEQGEAEAEGQPHLARGQSTEPGPPWASCEVGERGEARRWLPLRRAWCQEKRQAEACFCHGCRGRARPVTRRIQVYASEMSSKLKSHPAENGEHPKTKMENGTDSMAVSTYTPEEMVQQMKELITESNELKEAMKLHNQAMKDRYEELSICREKQKEEEFYELKFKEVKQRLLDKCMENEKLQQQLQNLKEREGAEMEGCMAPEKEMRQLISQVQWLQGEKADMLGIISDLQVKLNISAEDSFVEIGMNEGEINRTAKEHQENSGEMTSNIDIYSRSKTADESKNLQSEELIVSHCLRNETQKREELEKELQDHKERLSKLEKKTSNCLKSGTQTEQQAEESSEAVGSEVETLSLQVCALFKELQEAHEKVKEAELIQKQLQEKCQVLERKSSAAASELEEKQQLIYTIKKLELQVESMQAEVKLEQAKAHEEKARYSSLQDTNSKLLPELTKAMKTIDEMKLKELHRVDKVVVEQLNAKFELAEQAPVAKQLQIDEMKQIIANYLLLTVPFDLKNI